MAWIRYLAYFVGIAFVTWAIMQFELASPGGLKLHVVVSDGDVFGTSEFSPVEIVQAIILFTCGSIMAWVAKYCAPQRPLAILFGGLALVFIIRESDYFLDRFVIDNFWQVLVAIVGAFVIAYTYRHRRRLQIALARIWPSPGMTLLFAGANRSWPPIDIFGLAAGLGVDDRVAAPGYVSDADLAGLYNSAALTIYLSEYEGFGLPPLEALCSGCPVITSDGNALRQIERQVRRLAVA